MFASLLQVALGGALGAAARFLIGISVAFPYGTLLVNVLGSLLMGIAFQIMAAKGLERWMPLVLTGILGGFTTFSAFSLDVYRLYDEGRILSAGGYVAASVMFSITALFAGVALVRVAQG